MKISHRLLILAAAAILAAPNSTLANSRIIREVANQAEVASALAQRVMGPKAAKIVFQEAPAREKDFFSLESKGGRIIITGNDANSMAVGLNHYLKYYCHVEYGWLLKDSFTLPARLPKVPEKVEVSARVQDRFFLNYCTYGYSMPWWTWKDWEHFIDWMALNGINLPLAITGQESIWYQIWTEMGLSDQEVRSYFTGPAHLPWHRMQNMDRWFGPLPQSWLDGQLELQKQITARERELNMRPVLPAFSGHVPAALARVRPDAPITHLKGWCGFKGDYACSFLDPMSDLYKEIQKRFVQKETEIYGSDHIYGIDIFNELTPPSWEPDYLGRVSRQIYESLRDADQDARWLQMGWLFYCDSKNWTKERVNAYLTSFPTDRQIILDYYCDRQEVWQQTDKFFGAPYIWCYLGNFGGNTNLVGQFDVINSRIENTYANGGSNFTGIGATLEGLDCNPYVYEFVLEKAWNHTQDESVAEWTAQLADQRVGMMDSTARRAWKTIIDKVYVDVTSSGQSPCMNQRPNIGKTKTLFGNDKIYYDNSLLVEAVGELLKVDGKNSAYGFDITNLTRQMLSNYFNSLKRQYDKAYAARDVAAMDSLSTRMLGIMDDVDDILGTQSYFLVGKWIDDARSWGKDEDERNYFESNARNIITTWGDKASVLNDYANRTWNGLVKTFYKVRWEKFFAAVKATVQEGAEWDDARYQAYSDDVTSFEKDWWEQRIGSFAKEPVGDSKTIASELLSKYREAMAADVEAQSDRSSSITKE